jgi:hypothetical protein
VKQRAPPPRADNEVCLDRGLTEHLEQPDAVDGAGGSRDGHYQSLGAHAPQYSVVAWGAISAEKPLKKVRGIA